MTCIEKTCTGCSETKPITEFHKQPRGRCQRMAACKVCQREAHRRWRTENPETWKKAKRKAQTDYRIRLREKAVALLGGACAHCGITNLRVLEIDHICGGGGKESRRIGNHGVHLRVLAGEAGYQLLCANCHVEKTYSPLPQQCSEPSVP